jgi:inorganic triphosphatase YgiF
LQEVEAKFIVRRPGQVDELLQLLESLGYDVAEGRDTEHADTYYDTDDLAIFRAGWAYRCRRRGQARTLALKSTGEGQDSVFVREELEQPIAGRTSPANPRLPAGPVADRLQEIAPGRYRARLFTVATRRSVIRVSGGEHQGLQLEIALDRSSIMPPRSAEDGLGRLAFTELELELVSGDPDHLKALAARIVDEAHLLPAHYSKFDRGRWAAGVHVAKPVAGAAPRTFRGNDPFVDLLYWYLRQQLASIGRYHPIAWEGIHPEGVHKMRVAIRRTRAMLAIFGDVLPRRATSRLATHLRWLAQQLGLARDADVCEMAIAGIVAALPQDAAGAITPYAGFLRQRTVDAYTDLADVLGGERYCEIVAALERFVGPAPARATAKRLAGLSINAASKRFVRPAILKTLQRGDRIDAESTPAELHKLRIRAKRLRYLLDLFSNGQPRRWRDAIGALEKLQDLLGDHQDAITARERLHEFTEASRGTGCDPGTWLAIGRLMQREDDRIAHCRRRFPAAWARFRKAAR